MRLLTYVMRCNTIIMISNLIILTFVNMGVKYGQSKNIQT